VHRNLESTRALGIVDVSEAEGLGALPAAFARVTRLVLAFVATPGVFERHPKLHANNDHVCSLTVKEWQEQLEAGIGVRLSESTSLIARARSLTRSFRNMVAPAGHWASGVDYPGSSKKSSSMRLMT
jgi:hypothetical protein